MGTFRLRRNVPGPRRPPCASQDRRAPWCSVEEQDVTTMMEALFDIRTRVVDIHAALFEEEDDGEDEEPPLGEDDS